MPERSILVELEVRMEADSEAHLDTVQESAVEHVRNELSGPEFYSEEVAGSNAYEFCEVWVNEDSTPEQRAVTTAMEEVAAKALECREAVEFFYNSSKVLGGLNGLEDQYVLDMGEILKALDAWGKASREAAS